MSSIPLDYFLNDEELLKRHELAIPTDEMYRFFPPKEDIYLSDSDPQKNYRYIFNSINSFINLIIFLKNKKIMVNQKQIMNKEN
jgi:hypothetical protein